MRRVVLTPKEQYIAKKAKLLTSRYSRAEYDGNGRYKGQKQVERARTPGQIKKLLEDRRNDADYGKIKTFVVQAPQMRFATAREMVQYVVQHYSPYQSKRGREMLAMVEAELECDNWTQEQTEYVLLGESI